jgi:hypothetical protein
MISHVQASPPSERTRRATGDARACPVCGTAPMSKTGVLSGLPLLHCGECGHDCLATAGADFSSFYKDHYTGFATTRSSTRASARCSGARSRRASP